MKNNNKKKNNLRYFYIMGASGSGKTTLAHTIEGFFPESFFRPVQTTTRKAREGEVPNVDYNFVTEQLFRSDDIETGYVAKVSSQFAPNMYGTLVTELSDTCINLLPAAIEGVLTDLKKFRKRRTLNQVAVLFIDDTQPEAERENRNASEEEKYTKMMFDFLKDSPEYSKVKFIRISHSDLIAIRNNKFALGLFLRTNLNI